MITGETNFTITGGATTASIGTATTGGYVPSTTTDWVQQYHWTPSIYYSYWPSYQPDKTRQAFQILKLLEEKKLVKLTSVKKFVELVDEIYKIL